MRQGGIGVVDEVDVGWSEPVMVGERELVNVLCIRLKVDCKLLGRRYACKQKDVYVGRNAAERTILAAEHRTEVVVD